MSVPAASLPAIGARLVLVGEDGDLAAVQELQDEEEDVVSDGVDGDDMGIRGRDGEKASRRRRVAGGAAEKLSEVEAAGGEDATVGVHQPPLHAKGDITKGLAIDQQVEVVHGEGFEAFLHVAHDAQANTKQEERQGIGEDQEDPRSGFFMLCEGEGDQGKKKAAQ